MLAELNIIGIIVAVVVAIAASLLKRKEPQEDWDTPSEPDPRRQAPPRPRRPNISRWEEELRRVLEERPAPPPIARHEPPPVYQPAPPPVEEYQVSPDEGEYEGPARPRLAAFSEATETYAHASSLLQRTQEQLHQLHGPTHRAAPPAAVHHTAIAPELSALLKSLHHPQGARAAVLASVVLGPPRAFEV